MESEKILRDSLNSQKNKCVRLLRHFLRTDLYFLLNPVQLCLGVIHQVLVSEYKLLTEHQFQDFLTQLDVNFGSFSKKVKQLLGNQRFSVNFFTKDKVEKVNKKFILIQSKVVYLWLILIEKTKAITCMKRKNIFSGSENSLLTKRNNN